jgi:3-hydroxyisobutyrate dehydrogenase-like beta-hydroxyacid dehydrogenase
MVKQVGVIGLGKMGLPITRHLITKGFEVAVFDVQRSAVDAALRLGAKSCVTPREVAAASDVVLIIVGFDNEVFDVLRGEEGVFAGARENSIIAVASTVLPDTMKTVAAEADALGKNVAVLDIPMCRGEPAAEAGKILVLAGGEEAAFARCKDVLAAFADDIFLVGGLGAGQVGKMVNNLLLWACVCGNYEGLKLATTLGVDSEKLRPALLKSSASNWALETWLQPRPMPWAEKDMAIVLQEADNARLPMPLSGVIREVVKAIKIEKGAPMPKARK